MSLIELSLIPIWTQRASDTFK